MAKSEKKKAKQSRQRRERRFSPESTSKPNTVKALGALGAVVLGAGAWAQFGRVLLKVELPPYPFAPYVLAVGALIFGAAVWMGTSGEPVIRVGAGGVALERGELRRILWSKIERVRWSPEREDLTVRGTDETGELMDIVINPRSHPQASAWLVKEAKDRIPKLVDVPEGAPIPEAGPYEGQVITLEAVQVVGKRCEESDTIIAFEPDARVCPKCERVYHKHFVPAACECGASLEGMRVSEGAAALPQGAKGSAGESAKESAVESAKETAVESAKETAKETPKETPKDDAKGA